MTVTAAFVSLILTETTAFAVEGDESTSGGGDPPPLFCNSLLRSSSCYVGDTIQWTLGCSGGVAPYNYGFVYMETTQEIPVVVGVLLDTYFTSALDFEGLFLGDAGHYRFQFYVQDSTGAYAYSTYQYLTVQPAADISDVLGTLTSMIPSLPHTEEFSTPDLSISDFSMPELSVDDTVWDMMDSGFTSILPASLGALLIPAIIFLFLGRWLNK